MLCVTIGDSGVSAEFKPLCRRQYRIETVDISRFQNSLPALPGDDLVRIIITGESDRAPDLRELTALTESRFFYAELRDETTLPRDLWARAEEDNLIGLFLWEMRRRLDAAADEERANILLATRFGLAALEGGEDVCP